MQKITFKNQRHLFIFMIANFVHRYSWGVPFFSFIWQLEYQSRLNNHLCMRDLRKNLVSVNDLSLQAPRVARGSCKACTRFRRSISRTIFGWYLRPIENPRHLQRDSARPTGASPVAPMSDKAPNPESAARAKCWARACGLKAFRAVWDCANLDVIAQVSV